MKLDTKTILILTFEPDEITALKRALTIAVDTDSPPLSHQEIDFLTDLLSKL